MNEAMDTLELINILLEQRDIRVYQNLLDLFELLRIYEGEDFKHAHFINKRVRDLCTQQAKNKFLPFSKQENFYSLYKRALLFDSLSDLDAYLLYIEYDREPEKKFYLPRRKTLRPIVQDLQDLHDRVIKFLAVSLPPRVGKSTLCIFFLSWMMGKYPDKSNLMTGHSDKLTKGFHREVLSIINGDEYLWHDVFPNCKVERISAEDETIDINGIRRYPTLTCRSIIGSLTGVIDINGLAYVDDVIEDYEESLNPTRMDAKYSAYLNQVIDRMKEDAIELHVGTRWGVNDVIGRLQEIYVDNPLYRFRVIPALGDDEESNFEYDFNVGFSTAKYQDIKYKMLQNNDLAIWDAKYQGSPYIREGLVFPEKDLKTFKMNELPLGEPIKYMAVDIAWGGGDTLSAPIGYEFGESVYIVDWVFNNGDKNETRPIIKSKIISHKITYSRFEANNGGGMYAESIENDLRENGYRFAIESVTTTGGKNSSKHAGILAYAPDIKRNFYFLDEAERTPEYNRAMKELRQYVQNGKVKHDDSPDSLKQLAKMILEKSCTYEIGDRPF